MFDETAQISLLLSERIESLDAERDTLIVRLKEEKPRKYPLRRVVDAVLYVVKTGCQWRRGTSRCCRLAALFTRPARWFPGGRQSSNLLKFSARWSLAA